MSFFPLPAAVSSPTNKSNLSGFYCHHMAVFSYYYTATPPFIRDSNVINLVRFRVNHQIALSTQYN